MSRPRNPRDTERDSNLWLKAIEELHADGWLETTVAPNALFDEEYAEHVTSLNAVNASQLGGQLRAASVSGVTTVRFLSSSDSGVTD